MADRLKAQDITFFNRLPAQGATQDSSNKSNIGQQFDEMGNIKSITIFLIILGDQINLETLIEGGRQSINRQKQLQKVKKGGIVATTTIRINEKSIDIRIKDMRHLNRDMKAICKEIVEYQVKLPQCIKGVVLILNKNSHNKKDSQDLKDFLKLWKAQQKESHPLNVIISIPVLQFTTKLLTKFQELARKFNEIIIQTSSPIRLHQIIEKLYILKCSQYGKELQYQKFKHNIKIHIERLKIRKFKLQYSIINTISQNWKQKVKKTIEMILDLLQRYQIVIQSDQQEQQLLYNRYIKVNSSIEEINIVMSFIMEGIQKNQSNQQKMKKQLNEDQQQGSLILINSSPNKIQYQRRQKLKILQKVKQKLQKQREQIQAKMLIIKQKYKQTVQIMQKKFKQLDQYIKLIVDQSEKLINATSNNNPRMQEVPNQRQSSFLILNNHIDQEERQYKNKLDYKMRFQIKSIKDFFKKLSAIHTQLKKILCFQNLQGYEVIEKQPMCLLISSYLHQKLNQLSNKSKITPKLQKKLLRSIQERQKIDNIKKLMNSIKEIIETYDVDRIEDVNYNMSYLQWQISIQEYFIAILQKNYKSLKKQ